MTAAPGDVYRINDTGNSFVVVNIDHQYAIVENMAGGRRRRSLLCNLRPSQAKHGYTLVSRGEP